MRRRSAPLLRTLGVVAACLWPARSWAQLGAEIPVCSAAFQQSATCVVGDARGGAFHVWTDRRGANDAVFVLRTTPAGDVAPGWPRDGLAVCPVVGDQLGTRALADGAGGVFLVWEDRRTGEADLRATRLDEFGRVVRGWPAESRVVCGASGAQREPALCSDARGGFFVVWSDKRVRYGSDIYVQHLDARGASPASWPADGQPVCTEAGTQSGPAMVADGAGGAIVVWDDGRNGFSGDIFAQRITAAFAVAAWGPNGRAVCTDPGDQQRPRVAPDGTGGAYFAWQDARGAYYDIFVTRWDGAGDVDWGWPVADGLALCDAPGGQLAPEIVADGDGGAYITWFDGRSGDYDVYATRIGAHAALPPGWPSNGVALCTAPGDQTYPSLVADGVGGAFVGWTDRRRPGNADVYVARLTNRATPAGCWPANGVAVCAAPGDQTGPLVAANGRGGAIVTWTDARNGALTDVYARGVERAPVEAFAPWPSDGVAVAGGPRDQASAATPQRGATTVADGAGGAIVVWQDAATGGGDLRAQHVTSSGAVAADWPPAGVVVCGAPGLQDGACVAPDGAGGILVVWQDGRDASRGIDVYAQRVTAAGRIAAGWPVDGFPVCTAMRWQFEPRLAPDGLGGAYIVWCDQRAGATSDVYALHITDGGGILGGWPQNGVLVSGAVGEQGDLDIVANGGGDACVVWVDQQDTQVHAQWLQPQPTLPPNWPAGGRAITHTRSRKSTPRLVADARGGVIAAWVDAAGVFATRLEAGGVVVPGWEQTRGAPLTTIAGAMGLGLATDGMGGALAVWCHVDAHGSSVWAQHLRTDGTAAEGWPADGLRVAPGSRPQLCASIASDGGGGAYFAWVDTRRGDADVYAQHLDADGVQGADGGGGGVPVCTAPGIQSAPALVVEPSGCGALAVWHDARGGDLDVYATRLGPLRSAVDARFDPVVSDALRGAPNPFRGTTSIEFTLPFRLSIQVDVYDVAGRRVRTFAPVVFAPGPQRCAWDGTDAHGARVAAGTYLVRVHGAGYEAHAKLVRSR